MFYTLEKIWLNVKILLYNNMSNIVEVKEEIYLLKRKILVYTIWIITYLYNFVILLFFFYPNLFNMDFNIDNQIIIICKMFCMLDILSPLYIYIFVNNTKDFLKSIGYRNIFDNLDNNEIKLVRNKTIEKSLKILKINKYFKHYLYFEKIVKKILIDKEREVKDNDKEEFKKQNYRYNFFKITNYLTPHGSFMSYSLITSVYSTITLVIELSDFAFIIWSIYFFLLVLNIITIRFSIYSDFFKSQQFIVSIIQLLDLGTDIAFLYKIGGISSNTIELYGIYTILFYFTSLIISYFSLLLLYYYSFNERKIRDYKKTKEEIIKKLNDINNNDLLSVDEDLMRKKTVLELKKENIEKKEILKKKQMWANTTLSIFGDIPLSLLTLIIDSKNECSDSITILSIVTSILTFFLSISGIIDSIQKKKYEYKYSI